jgi:hypothetical protein
MVNGGVGGVLVVHIPSLLDLSEKYKDHRGASGQEDQIKSQCREVKCNRNFSVGISLGLQRTQHDTEGTHFRLCGPVRAFLQRKYD